MLAAGLASLLYTRAQCLLVAAFCFCCSLYHLSLLCWEQFGNSDGQAPGLTAGQGTAAVLARLESQREPESE